MYMFNLASPKIPVCGWIVILISWEVSAVETFLSMEKLILLKILEHISHYEVGLGVGVEEQTPIPIPCPHLPSVRVGHWGSHGIKDLSNGLMEILDSFSS